MATGYSATPLGKKLGLAEGGTLVTVHAPAAFADVLAPIPAGARVSARLAAHTMLMVLFCADTAALQISLPPAMKNLDADGALWIAWPKKTSSQFVDLTEDGIRSIVLPTGLVDVKVCAIDADWSGLKLMVRKPLRASWNVHI